MDDSANGSKGNSKRPGSGDFIDQIENLQLPKRMERRRSVYLGEQVSCTIRYDRHEIRVDVVDLSSRGLALVELREKVEFSCAVGQKIVLEFDKGAEKPYAIPGVISNLSQVQFGRKTLKRIGIQFALQIVSKRSEFWQALGEQVIPCRTPIRPQASCRDPFFFNELMVFQVEGFSAQGVELLASARCKSLFPQQRLELDFYLPGRGRFLVPVINAAVQQRSQGRNYRIFGRYVQPPAAFMAGVSEYLVMFGRNVTPSSLRAQGFHVGDLSHAFEVSYASLSEDILLKEGLSPSVLGLPVALGDGVRVHAPSPHARTIRCKLGQHLVGVMSLLFVEGQLERSQLHQAGYQLSPQVVAAGHLEWTDFHLSPKAVLADFLLPLLKNIVRIAVQGKAQYVVLACQGPVRPILQKMGFQDHGSPHQAGSQTNFLMQLPVNTALFNRDKFLPENIWRKVYQDLFEFFKTQSAKNRKAQKPKVQGKT